MVDVPYPSAVTDLPSGAAPLTDTPRTAGSRASRSGLVWRSVVTRERAPLVAAVVLICGYAVIRTLGAADLVALSWTAIAVGTSLLSPLAGMVVLASLSPFLEAQTAAGVITAGPVLAMAVVASVLGRMPSWWPSIAGRWSRSARWALFAGVAILLGTALGVFTTLVRLGPATAVDAARFWAVGIGAGLLLMFSSAVLGRRGHTEGLVAVTVATLLAGLLSLIDYLVRGSVVASPFGWLLRPDNDYIRLTGVIPAPNASAMLFLLPATMLGALALFPPFRAGVGTAGTRIRIVSAVLAVTMVTAVALAYSRSSLLALVVVVTLLAWRVRRVAGVVASLACIVGALALASAALDARGVIARVGVIDVNTIGDQQRIEAWTAALRMWADAPLTGLGFRSFEALHGQYGARVIASPHNEWLRFFAEDGTVVGILGLVFIGAALIALSRGRSWPIIGAFCTFGAFVVMASFNNPLTYLQIVVPTFIVIGTGLGLTASTTGVPAERDGG